MHVKNDILHKLWKSLTSNKLELHADNQRLLWLDKKTPLFVSLRHRWQEKTSQLQQSPCFNMSGCSVVFGINFMKWLLQSSVRVAVPVLPVLGIVQLTQPWPHQSAACTYIIYACKFSWLWVSSSIAWTTQLYEYVCINTSCRNTHNQSYSSSNLCRIVGMGSLRHSVWEVTL